MFRNNLTVAWRSLLKNKLPTAINIIGLAIGIAGCLIVFQIANHELSVNKDIVDGDRIYRVFTEFNGEFSSLNAGLPTGAAALAAETIQGAEVQSLMHSYSAKVEVPGMVGKGLRNLGTQEKIVLTGPSFFDLIQNFEWLEGSAYQSLQEPFQVVLTEEKVKQYFGLADARDAIGRELVYSDSLVLMVSGVLKNPTFNSDFVFTDFISASSIPNSFLKNSFSLKEWGGVRSTDQLFLKAADGVSKAALAEELEPMIERFNADKEPGAVPNEFKLQPLSELHFNHELGTFDYGLPTAQFSTIYGLMGIALLLLIIAAVNFINLATVQATRRSRETGVRKVIGATRKELALQYLTETALLAVLALPVAFGLSEFAAHYFAEFLPEGLVMNLLTSEMLLFLVGAVLVVTFLSGLYPAFMMSSFNPAFAIQNQAFGKGSSKLRKGLIAFQFVLAQAFIIGALVMGQQLHYALNKDLGFNKDALVYFYLPWKSEVTKRQIFKEELKQQQGVLAATLQNKPPLAQGYQTNVVEFEQNGEMVKSEIHFRTVDTAYLNVYGIKLLAGRNLLPSDTLREILVNEKLVAEMGYSNPGEVLGKVIKKNKKFLPIAGVVSDFHVRSFHHDIPPMAMSTSPRSSWSVAAKLDGGQALSVSLDKTKEVWEKVFPGAEFKYHFMNESIEKLYESELRAAKLINTATGLAVMISCLGLFGLAFFTVNARSKEISIRKVLGASVTNVVGLLSKEVVFLVAGSLLLAAPLAYFILENWLSDFAYRIEVQWWSMLLAGAAAIVVAFLTISFQSIKAALANPVESLRSE